MQLLEDVFIVENLQILTEGKDGPMRIRGCFQRADEENNNKRVYGKPLLEREIGKLAEAITERRLMGELDHPQHDSVKLSNVSHLITGLNMKGNEVIGEAEILDTPSGKVAQALIRGGVKVGVSSRGMGTVTEELDGKRYVNEDFKLITWDLVADPSTRGAYPGLTESTQIQEIIDKVLPEAQKVKNFTTLLKESLNEKEAKSSDTLHREGASTKAVGRREKRQQARSRAIERQALKSTNESIPWPKTKGKGITVIGGEGVTQKSKGPVKIGSKGKPPGPSGAGKPSVKPGSKLDQGGAGKLDIEIPRQDASTSLADLMRSKLYEYKEILPGDRARRFATRDTVASMQPTEEDEKRWKAREAKRKAAAAKKAAAPKRKDDSITLAGFMRTKLMEKEEEKTEHQKEVDRRLAANKEGTGEHQVRREKEHEEHGKPGETPRDTQIRIHGSGVPARMPRKRRRRR